MKMSNLKRQSQPSVNDDITGYLSHEYLRKMMITGEKPDQDEFEAAAYEGCLLPCHQMEVAR